MESVDRLGIFERLKHAIQLLACPPEIQLKTLPHFVCKADELGLDFDLWREIVLNSFRSEMSTDQLSSIENIDQSLSELTQMGPEYWTQDAVRQSAEWEHVRTLAAVALESFGWAQEIPPSYTGEYVGGK